MTDVEIFKAEIEKEIALFDLAMKNLMAIDILNELWHFNIIITKLALKQNSIFACHCPFFCWVIR